MAPEPYLYTELNQKWKSACKVIFGQEAGELDDFEDWLAKSVRPTFKVKSAFSGKDVSFVLPHSPADAKAASLLEVDFNKKFEPLKDHQIFQNLNGTPFNPLNINEIKDIDSVLGALGERVCYTGDIQLGNSKYIEDSSDVIESFYCSNSAQVSYSAHIAHCYNFEYSKAVFGSQNFGYCTFCIEVNDATNLQRCFQVSNSIQNADCIYSNWIFGCQQCMFCFNLRNARYRIGNLKLEPSKYLQLRAKLVSEMVEELKKEKKLPSLVDLVRSERLEDATISEVKRKLRIEEPKLVDQEAIEKDFEATTRVLFGRPLGSLEKYGNWLKKNIRDSKIVKSAVSGNEIVVADHAGYFEFPAERIVSEHEAVQLGEILMFSKEEIDGLSFSNIRKPLAKIAFFCPEVNAGKNSNNIQSQKNVDSVNFFRSVLNLYSKNGAYNYYVLQSEYVYGCNSVRKSSFAIDCYLSAKLSRCFEVDSSRDCSGCYFCHNCENVHDSLFCFNQKNKRNNIGNTELEKDTYSRLKSELVSQMADEIEKTGKLGISILNLRRVN